MAGDEAARERQKSFIDLLPPMLGDFLATDVRTDVERCDELLAGLARARSGERYATYGNVYELIVEPDGAMLTLIDDETEESVALSLRALENMLRAWRAVID